MAPYIVHPTNTPPTIDKAIKLIEGKGEQTVFLIEGEAGQPVFLNLNKEQFRKSYLATLESSLDEAGKDGFTEQKAREHASKIAKEITIFLEKSCNFNSTDPIYQTGLSLCGYNRIAELFDITEPEPVKDQCTEETAPAVPNVLDKNELDLLELFRVASDPKKLGSLLREYRETVKAKQEDIAEIMDISATSITKIEGGKGNPTWKTLTGYINAVEKYKSALIETLTRD